MKESINKVFEYARKKCDSHVVGGTGKSHYYMIGDKTNLHNIEMKMQKNYGSS